jgi:hypothetical protein
MFTVNNNLLKCQQCSARHFDNRLGPISLVFKRFQKMKSFKAFGATQLKEYYSVKVKAQIEKL